MFKLIKILGGRTNQSESHTIKVQPLSAAIAEGTPVSIKGGRVTVVDDSSSLAVTHIVDFAAAKSATSVKVTEVLPGMVFSSRLDGDHADYQIGDEHVISGGMVLADLVSTPHTGAVIYDIPERVSDGEILVTFPAN